MTRVFLIGYPGNVGGACTEAWHTLRLWKEGGMDVHAIPTWGEDAAWEARLDGIGIPTHHVTYGEIGTFNLLKDSIAVGMCNDQFFQVVGELRSLGCRLVWVGCMTWPFDAERVIYDRHGLFDAYVFQSEFQRGLLEPHLAEYGYDASRGHLIRGAFFVDEWEFRPRERGAHRCLTWSQRRRRMAHRATIVPTAVAAGSGLNDTFVVGRVARASADKWSPELWPTYERIGYRPLAARVMGWRPPLKRHCGRPPEWAETLGVDACPVAEFLHSLHCLVTINGGAQENWPRVGLEAMAAGLPIVTEKRWGWLEMIEHGVSGFLGETNEEIAAYATELANDEERRMKIAATARRHVERLAEPNPIWTAWSRLLDDL